VRHAAEAKAAFAMGVDHGLTRQMRLICPQQGHCQNALDLLWSMIFFGKPASIFPDLL
jgi:hypothetical protein